MPTLHTSRHWDTQRGRVGSVDFAYYDTRPLMGCMLEVVSYDDGVIERFAQIAAAAQGWDGRDPIRER